MGIFAKLNGNGGATTDEILKTLTKTIDNLEVHMDRQNNLARDLADEVNAILERRHDIMQDADKAERTLTKLKEIFG